MTDTPVEFLEWKKFREQYYLRGGATISDKQFVKGIRALQKVRVKHWKERYGREHHSPGDAWINIGELAEHFDIHPNRIRSKLRRTNKRKLTEGCTCGCRGDVYLLTEGKVLLFGEGYRERIEMGQVV